jgi:hypothetical protein
LQYQLQVGICVERPGELSANHHGEELMFDKPTAFAAALRRFIGAARVIMALWVAGGVAAMAQTTTVTTTGSTPVAPVANACQRFVAGSVVQQPPRRCSVRTAF